MYTRYDLYFKAILDNSWIQRKYCFKPISDISYSSNKISENILIFFYIYIFLATIINTLKKKTQQNFKSKMPPQVNKKGKRLFTQFNNHLT